MRVWRYKKTGIQLKLNYLGIAIVLPLMALKKENK
jgi:hypothetical protein